MPGDGFGIPHDDYPESGPPRLYVVRADAETGDFTILPNVEPLFVQERDGLVPAVAGYRFVFDGSADPAYPRRWHEVFGDASGIPFYSVRNDDRILLFEELADGTPLLLHDGFAEVPQVDTSGNSEQVSFRCTAVPGRCWDFPLSGMVIRDGTDPGNVPSDYEDDYSYYEIDERIIFNPQGRPNKCRNDAPSVNEKSGREFWPFVDPLIDNRIPDVREHWDVASAAIYLMETGNIDVNGDPDPFVELPDYGQVWELLQDLKPTTEGGTVDPLDDSTFTRVPILCHELDVTGDAWPTALLKLIEPYDFGARFAAEWDGSRPVHRLELYRKDEARFLRIFRAPLPYSTLDVTQLDQVGFSLVAATDEIKNSFYAITAKDAFELTIVLKPMYPISKGDENPDTRWRFSKKEGAAGSAAGLDYRLWGAGEAGDRFWSVTNGDWTVRPLDLANVFHPQADEESDGRRYARRRRPALGHDVFTLAGDEDQRADVKLEISIDYAGPDHPHVWDPSPDGPGAASHWRVVGSGCWKLSDVMFGIEVTDDDPWDWNIGKLPAATAADNLPFPSGKVDVLTCMANPDVGANAINPTFTLRLTARLAADSGIDAVARRRPFSPTRFERVARDDCGDRFRREIVDPSSVYTSTPTGQAPAQRALRDDTESAVAHVQARRRAHEALDVAGQVTIPYLAWAYAPGDRIVGFAGRAALLDEMDGLDQGEPPRWPVVVGRDRHFSDGYSTVILIGDDRGEPAFRPNFSEEATAKRARSRALAAESGNGFTEAAAGAVAAFGEGELLGPAAGLLSPDLPGQGRRNYVSGGRHPLEPGHSPTAGDWDDGGRAPMAAPPANPPPATPRAGNPPPATPRAGNPQLNKLGPAPADFDPGNPQLNKLGQPPPPAGPFKEGTTPKNAPMPPGGGLKEGTTDKDSPMPPGGGLKNL